MPSQRRHKVAEQVRKLAALRGWDAKASQRCEYTISNIDAAPKIDGVYRIYDDGDEVVYVGAAWRKGGLCARLKNHLKSNEHNEDLGHLLGLWRRHSGLVYLPGSPGVYRWICVTESPFICW